MEVAVALDTFIGLLQELRDDLGRGEKLTDVFLSASRWRQDLQK